MNINRTKEDDYFLKAILDNIKLVIILEFFTNLYVFDFWVELIFVPISAILGSLLAVSSSNPKYKQIKSCLTKIVFVVGLGFISFAIFNIVTDFQGLASTGNLKEFLLPLVFTVVFLPFIYIMALYITYDQIFVHLTYCIKDSSVARYTRWKTILSFHLNLKALNKWHERIVQERFITKGDVKQAILDVKRSGA